MIKDLLAEDTICAIATPVGLGGIGIIRISGKLSSGIVERIFLPSRTTFPLKSHYLHHGWVRDVRTGEVVDEVLVSFMKGPRTYTREDVVEINCHSGYAVLNRILKIVQDCGARLAEPGEFTYRAFINGRIDLLQAEAVLDLIESRTEKSLQMARNQLMGEFSERVHGWLNSLNELIAYLEAGVDFSDDVEEEIAYSDILKKLSEELIASIRCFLEKAFRSQVIKEGVRLALVGKPNVGKSSLLNAILDRERAIVTEYAGTTRDVIEDSFVLDGILIRIMDTAGIRKDADYIEKIGIERAIDSIREADVIFWLLDVSVPLSEEDEEIFEIIKSHRFIVVLNKTDLPALFDERDINKRFKISRPVVKISALVKEDVDRLLMFFKEHCLRELVDEASEALAVNERQKQHFEAALYFLNRACDMLKDNQFVDLVLYELYEAKKELEKILGKEGSPDDILDRVFSRFCIGK